MTSRDHTGSDRLELTVGGRKLCFPATWLRDNCPCAQWAELLAQPERQLNLRLAAGDCLVFDNTRILHARTAFSMAPGSPGSPGRRLQGCYADLDGLASTLAVLRRSGNHELTEES